MASIGAVAGTSSVLGVGSSVAVATGTVLGSATVSGAGKTIVYVTEPDRILRAPAELRIVKAV